MAITNGYTTLEDFKAKYLPDAQDTDDDFYIEMIITMVSREIDRYCDRHFYRNTVDETHYYTAREPNILYTEDIASITTLKTDEDGDRTYEVTWATTDYDLLPYNAAYQPQVEPYTWIKVTPLGEYTFPLGEKGVQITGKFGYSSTAPAAITMACMYWANSSYHRHDAPFGIMGMPGLGEMRVIAAMDPFVEMLLLPFRNKP